jgi:hypothetical protein
MNTPTETKPNTLTQQHNALTASQKRRARRTAIADTGATGNYIAVTDRHTVNNLKPHTSTHVYLPDGTTIQSSHAGTLEICNRTLPALVFPTLNCGSLISIGSLCDTDLHVIFTKLDMQVIEPATGKNVATGYRDAQTRLWHLSLETSSQATPSVTLHVAANVLEFRNVPQIIAFWKATFGSPTDDTLIKAVDNKFIVIPGLTSKRLRKYPSHSKATARGHLDQHRQGFRSTQSPAKLPDTAQAPHSNGNTYVQIVEMTNTNHSDLTGRFPVTSRSGNKYILVMFNEDSEYIHVEAMPGRSQTDYINAYSRGYKFFESRNIHPTFEHMDNEAY